MIKVKSNKIKLEELNSTIRCRILDMALICQKVEGKEYVMTITSANDGNHMKNSKHYSGEAIDIRRNDMKNAKNVVEEMRRILDREFDIVLEETHIHVEYDPIN